MSGLWNAFVIYQIFSPLILNQFVLSYRTCYYYLITRDDVTVTWKASLSSLRRRFQTTFRWQTTTWYRINIVLNNRSAIVDQTYLRRPLAPCKVNRLGIKRYFYHKYTLRNQFDSILFCSTSVTLAKWVNVNISFRSGRTRLHVWWSDRLGVFDKEKTFSIRLEA